MAQLSIGEALSDGFGLIGRRPLDCLVWGLAYFVLAVLPSLLVMGWILPDYLALMRDMFAHRGSMDGGSFTQPPMALAMKMQALQPVIWIGMIVGQAVVYSAIFRAVLRPQERGFFYLKFSSTELWVGLVMLVQLVCMWLTMIALAIPGVILWIPTMIAAANRSMAGWEIPVGVIGVLVAAVAFVWLAIRFSMAVPLSFAEGQFRLFESWGLTRGRGFSLFLLYLVITLILFAIVIIIEVALAVIMIRVLSLNLGGGSLQAFMQQPADRIVATAAPYVIGLYLLGAVFTGFFFAAVGGSWASAYRQLAPAPAQA